MRHVVGDVDRRRQSPFFVGPAMALDHGRPSRPRKTPPFARLGSILARSASKAGLGQEITEFGAPGAAHRSAQIFADLLGGALGGLECDVAGEAFRHHHVDGALADIVGPPTKPR